MRKFLFFTCLAIILSCAAFGARVYTVEVFSTAMNKNLKTVVIVPDDAGADALKPTVYLLHGYSGNYSNWISHLPELKDLSDQYQMVFVCPEGGYGSWYWDIPGDRQHQYETFVADELVRFMEENYPVRLDRRFRAITGLSMGGHGALYLALRNQDIYSAVGSTSGGVDFRPWPNSWEIKDRLGPYHENPEAWTEHSVINMLHLYQPGRLSIFVDCGTEDFFYGVNEALHQQMQYFNIPHHYQTMPGKHNWDYWTQSIRHQLVFFNDHFSE